MPKDGETDPRDEMPLQPQVTLEPFEKLGMDFVGPINPPSRQKSYIIVCIDYLTKWEETKAIKAATKEKVAEFLRKNIFYKFGYLIELVTDQGSQFTFNLIEYFLSHHKIKHRTSTPYHPQANGQVEVTNTTLEGILTKVVSSNRRDWADHLVETTWAYNTLWKTTTSFTPYELVYGKRALLSIEFEYNTLRMAAQLDLDLSHALQERLMQLNGHKDFKGKLRTRWLGPYAVEKCNDNGSVLIRTIDEEAIPMLVNGHRLKIYSKPLSRQEFVKIVGKSVLVIEKGPASVLGTP
eukprot:PITA_03563